MIPPRRPAKSGAEKRRVAICAATRDAVAAGVFEIPPRVGSLGARHIFEELMASTAGSRALLAEAVTHEACCMRRVPDRPLSVGCECRVQKKVAAVVAP